jgi:hypothetical protein
MLQRPDGSDLARKDATFHLEPQGGPAAAAPVAAAYGGGFGVSVGTTIELAR